MGKDKYDSGLVIQTDDGHNTKAMIWGWGAVFLGIAAVVAAYWIGLAACLVAGGIAVYFAARGIGEGIKHARLGDAARIEAKARMIEARHRDRLPPPY